MANMYVASAANAAPSAAAYLAARGGFSTAERADSRVSPDESATGQTSPAGATVLRDDPIVGRYPVVAFSYNADASRLVMLYRDPATGETESQIPSEAALKQYEEAQRKERKENKPTLALVVGGDGTASRGEAAAKGGAGSAGTGTGAGRTATFGVSGVSGVSEATAGATGAASGGTGNGGATVSGGAISGGSAGAPSGSSSAVNLVV